LDLYNNQVGASGAERLAEALQRNSTLTSLDLRINGVGATKLDTHTRSAGPLHGRPNGKTGAKGVNGVTWHKQHIICGFIVQEHHHHHHHHKPV